MTSRVGGKAAWPGGVSPDRSRPTAHLLFGYLGAGKTTLARELERRHGAIRFTPDEWMAGLFGSDDPPVESFATRAAAILRLLEPVWIRCLELGNDVVLDYGFWRRSERDQVRSRVEAAGAEAILYAVECPEGEARERVQRRNCEANRSLYIAPATFDALRSRFEPLQPDEAFRRVA